MHAPAQMLAVNKGLERLSLRGTAITDAGAQLICNALQVCLVVGAGGFGGAREGATAPTLGRAHLLLLQQVGD